MSFRPSGGTAYLANRVSHARYLRGKYPKWPRVVLWLPFAAELWARSVTRQPEGRATLVKDYRLASRELRNPGSVQVLDGPASTEPGPGVAAA